MIIDGSLILHAESTAAAYQPPISGFHTLFTDGQSIYLKDSSGAVIAVSGGESSFSGGFVSSINGISGELSIIGLHGVSVGVTGNAIGIDVATVVGPQGPPGIVGSYVTSVNGMSGDVAISEPDIYRSEVAAISGSLAADISGKANAVHGHSMSDIANLSTALAGKVETATLQTTASNLMDAINAEATARANADTALQSQLSSVQSISGNFVTATTLGATATSLLASISSEATSRANADTALQSQLTSVQSISGNWVTAATLAASANSLLTLSYAASANALNQANTARATADAALQSQLTSMQSISGNWATTATLGATATSLLTLTYAASANALNQANSARVAADAVLQSQLTSVQSISGNWATTATLGATAASLLTSIGNEATSRSSADAVLQSQLTSMQSISGNWATSATLSATATSLLTSINAKLNSSSYTAADVLAKTLTVDGAGSTLDADLLDGQHGSYYATDSLAVHKSGSETLTGLKTFTSTTNPTNAQLGISPWVSGTTPLVSFISPTAATNQKIWDIRTKADGTFVIAAPNDGYSSSSSAITIARSDTTITSVTMDGDAITNKGGRVRGAIGSSVVANEGIADIGDGYRLLAVGSDAVTNGTIKLITCTSTAAGYATALAANGGTVDLVPTGGTVRIAGQTAWHAGNLTPSNYVAKSGDTMAGNLSVTNGTGIATLHNNGDVTANRGDGTGVIYFGNSGAKYLYFDGTNYSMPGGNLYINGNVAWNAANDGSGSGLDADLLDGQQGSYYAADSAVVHKAGYETITGRKQVSLNTVDNTYTNSSFELVTSDGSSPGISFHRAGYSAINVYHSGDGANLLRLNRWAGGDYTIWHSGYMGNGTGLDADLLRGIGSSSAVAANTVATRDSNGDLFARYINTTDDSGSGGSLTYLIGKCGDNYHKSVTAANVKAWLGSSLLNFNEAANTAAPNDTKPAHSLTPNTTAYDADIVIAPKGSGALLVEVPDSAVSGGNKRGNFAIDLQMERSSAGQVASGNSSAVIAGANNTATQQYSSVLGGNGNAATALGSTVIGGTVSQAAGNNSGVFSGAINTASGINSGIVCGSSNAASGQAAVIVGGTTNNCGAINAVIAGGASNAIAATATSIANHCGIYGGNYNSINKVAGDGNAIIGGFTNTISAYGHSVALGGRYLVVDQPLCTIQGSSVATRQPCSRVLGLNGFTQEETPFYAYTSDATTTAMSNYSGWQYIPIAAGECIRCTVEVAAQQLTTTNAAGYVIEFTAKNAGGTVSIVGTTVVRAQENNTAWNMTVTVVAGTGVAINVIGAAAANVSWFGVARLQRVKYG